MPKTKAATKKKKPVSLAGYRTITLRILDETSCCAARTDNNERRSVYMHVASIIIGRLVGLKKSAEVKHILQQYTKFHAYPVFSKALQESAVLRKYKKSQYLP